MAIISKPFGVTKKGDAVTMFTMTNKVGASVSVIELGAIITSIVVPDKNGKMADVTLGFETLDRYEGDHAFMGDLVGRYGNRIAKAHFTLDGVEYNLAVNNNANILKTKKAIKKAMQYELEGKGFCLIEVLSTCPTNWGLNPVEAMKWLEENMIPYYPLGVKKDKGAE